MPMKSLRSQTAPGPRLPVGLKRLRTDATNLLTGLNEQYGPVSRVRIGPYLFHQVCDPAFIKMILQDRSETYTRGKVYRGFELFFGKGLLTADGAEWQVRRTTTQPFYRSTYLAAAVPAITACVDDLVRSWRDAADRQEPIDVAPSFMRLAMSVLTRAAFGADVSSHGDKLVGSVDLALHAMVSLRPRNGLRVRLSRID